MSFFQTISEGFPKKKEIKKWNWKFVLYDQLSHDHPLLSDPNAGLIFIETSAKPALRPYHKQKLVILLSSMRHFAMEMKERGFPILYWYSEKFYDQALLEILEKFQIPKFEMLEAAEKEVSIPISKLDQCIVHKNTLFLSDEEEFNKLFQGKSYLQETFYKYMRKKYNILIETKSGKPEPVGGQWNFDKENRLPHKKGDPLPFPYPRIPVDAITKEVIDLIESKYQNHWGDCKTFAWPVTRKDSLIWLDHFVKNLLPYFGPFEDAMNPEEPFLFHSLLSPLIHLNLISPKEVIQSALEAYKKGKVNLSCVEGFVRQILGWREYMRNLYNSKYQEYQKSNFFQHKGNLPPLYWGKKSGLDCLDSAVSFVYQHGYSHHIYRLMVLSNFANLTETNPHELNHWFWSAYIDAFEWVVTPNVVGMGTFADGGISSTKPYIASANYISKMGSGHCKRCKYNPKGLLEEDACPFNALYWNFIDKKEKFYQTSARRDFGLLHLNKMDPARRKAIREKAKNLINWIRG
jgi:deoxyribodipyrimidine photolyase-related protein